MIVDDEAPARSELRFLLDELGQVEVVAEAASVREAIEKLKESTFAHKLDDNVGARHAKAIYDDISDSGTLDESKLNIKSEGLIMAALRAPMAVRLMRTGKMNPMNGHPVNPEIETIRKIVKNAEAASKEAE
jgi:succinate dehydrogenase / fumarate reductase iron-sulfur subunit